MKSPKALFIPTVGTTICLSVLLSGCGQPGPLYLPKTSKPATSTALGPAGTPAAPSAPVTAPPPANPVPVPQQ